MGNVSFNFLFRKGYALHTKNWQYHINDRSHLLKVVSILHVSIFYEACLQQKSTLAIARKPHIYHVWTEKPGHCMHQKFHCRLTVRNCGIVCHDV